LRRGFDYLIPPKPQPYSPYVRNVRILAGGMPQTVHGSLGEAPVETGVYPRAMAGMSAEPPDSGDRSVGGNPADTGERADARASESEHGGRGEHAGPLAIARYVKDDGRALILYSHEQLGRT
jgi:hypothetical protein